MAVIKPKIKKPKAKYEKPTLKNRIGSAIGTAIIAGTLMYATKNANNPIRTHDQRTNNKFVIEQRIDKKKLAVEVPKSNSKNPNLIRETVNSYNKKAKTGQIYFYDGKKINNVYFDQTRLNQIRQILPEKEKANIDSLIARKVAKVEATAERNVVLGKKIIDRVGELDYTKYLLSLTPRELSQAFPEAETAVRKALENSNPQVLKKIKSDLSNGEITAFISTTVTSLLWGFLYVRGKKIKMPTRK